MAIGRRINLKDKKGNIIYPNIHNLISINSLTGAFDAPKLLQNGVEVMTKEDKGEIDEQIAKIYPVGAVYINVDGRNPSTLVGGTWEQFGQGRTLIGVNADDESFNEALKIGGDKEITLSASQIPSHNHSFTADGHTHTCENNTGGQSANHTHTLPSHTHGMIANHVHGVGIWSWGQNQSHNHWIYGNTWDEGWNHIHWATTGSAGAHTHSIRYKGFSGMNQSTGGYMVLRRNDSADSYDGTDGDGAISAGAHTHDLSTGTASANHAHHLEFSSGDANQDHQHYVTGNTGGPGATNNASDWSGDLGTWGVNADHSHWFSATTSSAAQGGSIGNTGGGGAHSNLQPYITVYFWRRTA